MGYRSQIQLLVAGPEAKVKEFLTWMKSKVEPPANDELIGFHPDKTEKPKPTGYFYTYEDTWKTILDLKTIEESLHNNAADPYYSDIFGVAFECDWIKAYDPWDAVINEIQEYCDDKDLSFAYGRIGEDCGDVDLLNNGKEYYVYCDRTLSEPFQC